MQAPNAMVARSRRLVPPRRNSGRQPRHVQAGGGTLAPLVSPGRPRRCPRVGQVVGRSARLLRYLASIGTLVRAE